MRVEGPVAIASHDPSCTPTATGPALICTGSLIAKNVVLTAAHCLESGPLSALDVVSGGRRLRVRGGRRHPAFDSETHAHDIAVLFLSEDAVVSPIPLRREPMDLASAAEGLRVVGFGNDSGAEQQGMVTLAAIEPEQLKLLPGPSMTCHGDSGGPLLRPTGGGFELVGVTTHGDPACRVDGYAARIDVHLAFIDEALAEPQPSAQRPFAPSENLCALSCSSDAECPQGLTCLLDQKRCSFGGLPPSRFEVPCTDSCGNDVPCARLGPDTCRCADPCTVDATPDAGVAQPRPVALAGGGGCTTASGPADPFWALAVLALLARRR